jgi:hypothetical protein
VARGLQDRIGAEELEHELLELGDELRDENLPIDVLDMAEPTAQEVEESDRSSWRNSGWSPSAASGCADASTTTIVPLPSVPVGSAIGCSR